MPGKVRSANMFRVGEARVALAVPLIIALLAGATPLWDEVIFWEPITADNATFVRPAPRRCQVRSRVSFRLHVFPAAGRPLLRTFSRPGRYTLTLACQHKPYVRHSLAIEIEKTGLEALVSESEIGGVYLSRSVAEIQAIKGNSPEQRVRLRAAFQRSLPYNPALSTVQLEDGTTVPVGAAFSIDGGFLCLVPKDEPYATAVMDAAAPHQMLIISGTVLAPGEQLTCVLVDDLQFAPSDSHLERTAVWKVKLKDKAENKTCYAFYRPGLYRVSLPCDEGEEILTLALREIKVADLRINGHSLEAEVADTPTQRRYGLQGRSGLQADTGMLFVFEKPLKPTFVMKTVSFPLSIAFFQSDGTIASIHRMFPGEQRPVWPTKVVKYALETTQGWFERHGIKPGARVEFE